MTAGFQSTPPRGGRHRGKVGGKVQSSFNPRPRAGGDQSSILPYAIGELFQSTPPRGGRQSVAFSLLRLTRVSIHAPARGATGVLCYEVAHHDVSIHAPARGATEWSSATSTDLWVSIHAPARGATKGASIYNIKGCVSIHAPARGATFWLPCQDSLL